MTSEQDQAKSIAERVARRVKNNDARQSTRDNSNAAPRNGSPVREELSAIRAGLHDLEHKLDRIESKIVPGGEELPPQRARLINFVSSGPPVVKSPSIVSNPARVEPVADMRSETASPRSAERDFVPATHSPWLRDFPASISHPSEERFGVEEATVTELVEFFENEKKCSMDPSGKPCDHCAMCSSRGF